MIEVNNLVKRYGAKVAVDHISFRIDDGEVVGFLGPNGAGKSTTMNVLTGYISSTDGSVKIDGYDVLENPAEVKRRIGFLPENPPLYMDMTVNEYLRFACSIKGVRRPYEKHISDICELVGIAHVRKRLIRNLSKGYKQRTGPGPGPDRQPKHHHPGRAHRWPGPDSDHRGSQNHQRIGQPWHGHPLKPHSARGAVHLQARAGHQ